MRSKVPLQKRDGRLIPIMNNDPKEFPGEEWKDIPHLDGYQVSSHGRVRSIDRYTYDCLGRQYFRKGIILRLVIRKEGAYDNIHVEAVIGTDNVRYNYSVCRLVYSVFVASFDTEDRSQVVIRENGDLFNCHYKNLKLVSVTENITDGYAANRRKVPPEIPVHQYDTNGKYLRTFDSISKAARAIGTIYSSLYATTQLPQYRCKGFYFRCGDKLRKIDVSEFNENRSAKTEWHGKKSVQKISSTGRILKVFESLMATSKATEIDVNALKRALRNPDKKYKGFYWKYAEVKGSAVHQYDACGAFLKSYDSAIDAAKAMGVTPSAIRCAARSKQKMSQGFYWKYGEQPQIDVSKMMDHKERYLKDRKKVVQKRTLRGRLIYTYPTLRRHRIHPE